MALAHQARLIPGFQPALARFCIARAAFVLLLDQLDVKKIELWHFTTSDVRQVPYQVPCHVPEESFCSGESAPCCPDHQVLLST